MPNLMKHAPATQYFLLDRPADDAPPSQPVVAPRPTHTLVRHGHHHTASVRFSGGNHVSRTTDTEGQLIEYLRETYGKRRTNSDELRHLGHMPFLSTRW